MNDVKESSFKMMWRVLYPILIYYGISVIISSVATTIIATPIILKEKDMEEEQLLALVEEHVLANSNYISIITAAIVIPILLILFLLDKKKEKISYKNAPVRYYGIVGILGIVSCVGFSNLIDIMQITKLFPYYTQVTEVALRSGGFLVSFVATAVCAPILEELLFRGIIYKRLYEYLGKFVPAMIISAVLFAVMHGNMVQGIYAFIIAIFLCFVYDKMRSIWAPIVFHFGANAFSSIANETKILDKVVTSNVSYIIITVICLILVAVCTVIIKKQVKVSKITEA